MDQGDVVGGAARVGAHAAAHVVGRGDHRDGALGHVDAEREAGGHAIAGPGRIHRGNLETIGVPHAVGSGQHRALFPQRYEHLVGAPVLKATGGKANPGAVNDLLKAKLGIE